MVEFCEQVTPSASNSEGSGDVGRRKVSTLAFASFVNISFADCKARLRREDGECVIGTVWIDIVCVRCVLGTVHGSNTTFLSENPIFGSLGGETITVLTKECDAGGPEVTMQNKGLDWPRLPNPVSVISVSAILKEVQSLILEISEPVGLLVVVLESYVRL